MDTVQIYDTMTNEMLIQRQDPMGVYHFSKDIEPMRIQASMSQIAELLRKIEVHTGRKCAPEYM